MPKATTTKTKPNLKKPAAPQLVDPTPAAEQPDVAPKKAKAAKVAPSQQEGRTARDGSKKAAVLELLRRPTGATLEEIMTATSWQAHTVRGFISGTLGKKLGLAIGEPPGEDKVRTYRLAD